MHNCIRNIVGQAPRGDDFFPRPDVIRVIYRRLQNEGHVHISAPRRAGKTAIMRYLEDHPEEGYEFKYIITESIGDPLEFYERLLEAIKEFRSISKMTLDSVTMLLKQIKNLQVLGTGVSLDVKVNYLKECKSIISKLSTNGKKIVLMIDEFPQTVENILQEKGEAEAIRFLHANREMREEASKQFRFLYTGSLGLKPLCSRLGAIDALNTLTTIEIGPLSFDEAYLFCESVLRCACITFQPKAITHLLQRIQWLSPFHLQLALQELIDESDRGIEMIDSNVVDQAIDKITYRRNDQYFETYHTRIIKMFSKNTNEYRFIKSLLNALCQKDKLTKDEVDHLAKNEQLSEGINKIVNILQYDGYLHEETSTTFRFTSPLLKIWWCKNMS